jgi:hypothetical protein
VTVTTGRTARGAIAFVANWSAGPVRVTTPAAVIDLVSGVRHAAGTSLLLEPRAALVFEATDDPTGPSDPSTESTP